MANSDANGPNDEMMSRAGDEDRDAAAFLEGYQRVERELAWAAARGWTPTQRELTVALMRTVRVYATVRRGKVVSGHRPEWLHGRAEALRDLVREGAGG